MAAGYYCMLWLIAVVAISRCQDTIVYFYTTKFDTCSYKGNYFHQSGLTLAGGMCAYDSTVDRIYTCRTE